MAELPTVTVVTYIPPKTPRAITNAVVNNVEKQIYDGSWDHHVVLDTYAVGETHCLLTGVKEAALDYVVIRRVDDPAWFPTWLASQMRWQAEGRGDTVAVTRDQALRTLEMMASEL